MHLVFIRLQPPFPCVVKQEIKMTLKLRNNNKKKLRKKLASVALTSFPLLRNKSMNDNNNNNFQNCERFEPRSHFKRLSLIVRVNVVLNRTVVVDSD